MGSIIPGIAGAGAGAASATDFDEPRASCGSLFDFDADFASGAAAAFGCEVEEDLDADFASGAAAAFGCEVEEDLDADFASGAGCATIGAEPRALRECEDGAGSAAFAVRGASVRSRVFDEECALRDASVTIFCELRRAAATSAGWGASTTRGDRARGTGAIAGCSACTDGSVRSRVYAGATYDGCSYSYGACGTWGCTADRCTYGVAGVARARSRVGGSVVRS